MSLSGGASVRTSAMTWQSRAVRHGAVEAPRRGHGLAALEAVSMAAWTRAGRVASRTGTPLGTVMLVAATVAAETMGTMRTVTRLILGKMVRVAHFILELIIILDIAGLTELQGTIG